MQTYTFRTIIEADARGFHGYVPALRGCHTWGKTIAETQKYLRDVIALYCESLVAQGESIPRDTSFESFETVEIVRKSKQGVRVGTLHYA